MVRSSCWNRRQAAASWNASEATLLELTASRTVWQATCSTRGASHDAELLTTASILDNTCMHQQHQQQQQPKHARQIQQAARDMCSCNTAPGSMNGEWRPPRR